MLTFAALRRNAIEFFCSRSISHVYMNGKFPPACAANTIKKPGGVHPARLCKTLLRNLVLVGQHSFISAAAVLINDPLTGLVVDLVALPAGLSDVFSRCFVTVTEENHRFVVRI
jgi:hypothetical protein